jgi:hypothetical protein
MPIARKPARYTTTGRSIYLGFVSVVPRLLVTSGAPEPTLLAPGVACRPSLTHSPAERVQRFGLDGAAYAISSNIGTVSAQPEPACRRRIAPHHQETKTQAHQLCSTRARSVAKPARLYHCRLSSFKRLTYPSVTLLLHSSVNLLPVLLSGHRAVCSQTAVMCHSPASLSVSTSRVTARRCAHAPSPETPGSSQNWRSTRWLLFGDVLVADGMLLPGGCRDRKGRRGIAVL